MCLSSAGARSKRGYFSPKIFKKTIWRFFALKEALPPTIVCVTMSPYPPHRGAPQPSERPADRPLQAPPSATKPSPRDDYYFFPCGQLSRHGVPSTFIPSFFSLPSSPRKTWEGGFFFPFRPLFFRHEAVASTLFSQRVPDD